MFIYKHKIALAVCYQKRFIQCVKAVPRPSQQELDINFGHTTIVDEDFTPEKLELSKMKASINGNIDNLVNLFQSLHLKDNTEASNNCLSDTLSLSSNFDLDFETDTVLSPYKTPQNSNEDFSDDLSIKTGDIELHSDHDPYVSAENKTDDMPSRYWGLSRKERIKLLLMNMNTYPHKEDSDIISVEEINNALANQNEHGDAHVANSSGVPEKIFSEPDISQVEEHVAPDISDNNVPDAGEPKQSHKDVNSSDKNMGTNNKSGSHVDGSSKGFDDKSSSSDKDINIYGDNSHTGEDNANKSPTQGNKTDAINEVPAKAQEELGGGKDTASSENVNSKCGDEKSENENIQEDVDTRSKEPSKGKLAILEHKIPVHHDKI